MADVEICPPVVAEGAEFEHGLNESIDVMSEHSGTSHHEVGDIDTSSLHTENEFHAAQDDGHDADGDIAVDKAPEASREGGAEPAGMEDATSVPEENGEKSNIVAPQKSPSDASKAVKKTTAAVKPSPVKTGKTTTGPAALAKKVINSGSAGARTTKPAAPIVSKAASTTAATARPAASAALRKSTSTVNPPASKATNSPSKARASATTSRPTMTTRPGTSSSVASSTTTATRRPSLPPKPPLAGSTTRRAPSPALTADTPRTTTRTVVSPVGSAIGSITNRPRASISDGIPATARRTSLGPKPTAPTTTTKPNVGARRTPTLGSISSLKDIKEDATVLDHMQTKLRETEATLKAQVEQTESLRTDLKTTREQLEAARAEANSKQTALGELQRAKEGVEVQLSSQTSLVQQLRTEIDSINNDIRDVRAKLDAAQIEVASKTEQIQTIESQLESLTKENVTARQEIKILTASSVEAASNAAAAALEHEALLKASADLDAIRAEISALTTAHEAAQAQADTKIRELEGAAARAEDLAAQVATLKTEKEENANKLSELEVEILELRESAEAAEDKEKQALARVKALEDQITDLHGQLEQAEIEAKKKHEEYDHSLVEIKQQNEDALKTASDERYQLSTKLKDLEEQLAAAASRYNQALADANSAEEAHAAKLGELEKVHSQKADELSSEISRLANELAGQEAQYAAKLETVKEEHDRLLQEAYQKAKTEAGDAHAQDLHALRTQSQAMIEQLNAAHTSFIEELKAEHEAALDAKVNSLDKTINNQALELKATQDALSKAKAALSSSVNEIETLKNQIAEAEKAASAVAINSASEHTAEVLRLTRELSSAHDEATALKEVLNAQKDSISEMSSNHTKELEIAAKGRAEEVMKLRSEHEEEVFALLKDKSELASRVTDLEGEVATLQATLAAQSQTPAVAKGNGIVPSGSATVSKEDLQKLHEAHNTKLHDLEAQHERSIASLRSDLDTAVGRTEDLQNEVGRKSMEINYLESEAEEKDDIITRLKEDIAQLTEQIEKLKQGSATA